MQENDKHLLVRLVYGVTQQRLRLDYIISQFSSVKPSRMKPMILNILRLAVYQSECLDRIPDYALVNESVELAKRNGLGHLSGFVNGVLRAYLRGREAVEYPKASLHYMSTYYSYPQWLVKLIRDKYKEKTEWILQQGNLVPIASNSGKPDEVITGNIAAAVSAGKHRKSYECGVGGCFNTGAGNGL